MKMEAVDESQAGGLPRLPSDWQTVGADRMRPSDDA